MSRRITTLHPQKLRSARGKAGLTQDQLATSAGVSPRTIRNLEAGRNGKRGPYIATIHSIVTALKADVDELITEQASA